MKPSPFFLLSLFIFLAGFHPAKAQTMLTGKIVDSSGKNLSGCRVHVCGADKQDSSDQDGVYRIFVLPGQYQLEVFRAGSIVRRRTVEIPKEDFFEADFVLPLVTLKFPSQ